MNLITQDITVEHKKYVITWMPHIKEDELSRYHPITQAYGVCFNEKNEILILDQKGDGTWTLPGGTVESGETLRETLERELMEEADVKITDITFIGIQSVKGEDYFTYQSRFSAKVSEILPQTPDPAKGRIHARKFVPANQITDYIRWGKTGNAMFSHAIYVYKHLSSSSF